MTSLNIVLERSYFLCLIGHVTQIENPLLSAFKGPSQQAQNKSTLRQKA